MHRQVFLFILSLFVICACSKKETSDERETGYLTLNITQATNLKADVDRLFIQVITVLKF